MKKFDSCVGWGVRYLTLLLLGTILNGWALSILWAWLIVPTFSLPYLTIAQAIGLSFVIRFIANENPSRDSAKSDFLTAFLIVVLTPVAAVLIAWPITLFL